MTSRLVKKEFHVSKEPIALNLVNVNQILISDRFKHSDTDFEYFSGYRDDNIFKPLCIILPQMSGYIKYFDNGGKYIYSLLLCLTHVTYVTLHHIGVIRYSTHVTYRTLCHASGHLLIYCECYRFERVFFYFQAFFTLHFFLLFQGFPKAESSTSKLAGLHADLQNIAEVRLFV